MTITLNNNTNRMRVFILKHEEFCERIGDCRCVLYKEMNKQFASVISIPSRSKIEGLPDEILEVERIKQAISEGILSAQVIRKRKVLEKTPRKRKKSKASKKS